MTARDALHTALRSALGRAMANPLVASVAIEFEAEVTAATITYVSADACEESAEIGLFSLCGFPIGDQMHRDYSETTETIMYAFEA